MWGVQITPVNEACEWDCNPHSHALLSGPIHRLHSQATLAGLNHKSHLQISLGGLTRWAQSQFSLRGLTRRSHFKGSVTGLTWRSHLKGSITGLTCGSYSEGSIAASEACEKNLQMKPLCFHYCGVVIITYFMHCDIEVTTSHLSRHGWVIISNSCPYILLFPIILWSFPVPK